MIELPLFPLNTVLFPGMPLNLHIFEERYKIMMNRCIDNRVPFGVVLIANDVPDTSQRAQTHPIGCTAQINQVQPLGGGQMNISAIGQERFQIVSYVYDKPYLAAMVEMYPVVDQGSAAVVRSSQKLREYVSRYLEVLKQAGQVQFDASRLPSDSASLTYLAAVLLQNITIEQKQEILASERMMSMVRELRSEYKREVTLLEAMLNPPEDNDFRGIFSLN